jgi:hypothetical protein
METQKGLKVTAGVLDGIAGRRLFFAKLTYIAHTYIYSLTRRVVERKQSKYK